MNFLKNIFSRDKNTSSKTQTNFNQENQLMMECPSFSGQAICSDDECPCNSTKMPPATGYLLIRPEVVKTRKNCLSLAQMQAHMSKSGVTALNYNTIRLKYLPIAVCEKSAKMRNLDLKLGVFGRNSKARNFCSSFSAKN